MLLGSLGDVRNASQQAICDAGKDGRFILSTGDQRPRDTPFEDIHAMMEAAESYGRY
jgi:uroporphyrinogen-III decarboxylase